MVKTCFILTSLASGGTERYLLRFLKYSEGKVEATVLCKGGVLGVLEEDFRATNAEIIALKTGYLNVSSWMKVYKIFIDNEYDSVVDLTGNFAGVFMLISYFARIHKRIAFYRYSSNQFIETKFKLLYNQFVKFLVYRFATKILSNSRTALETFFNRSYQNDTRFKVILNGIDVNDFNTDTAKDEIRNSLGIPKGSFVVGHIGRFDSSKNHKTIVEVAKRLMKRQSDIKFLFCGGGTDSAKFEKLFIDSYVSKQVYLLGERSDVPDILKVLDVFYFPSLTEGQPNALIEAMLSRIPIVASNISAIKEIIPLEMHSELLDPYDVDGAIKRIELLIENPNAQQEYKLIDWSNKKFDSKVNFEKFINEL